MCASIAVEEYAGIADAWFAQWSTASRQCISPTRLLQRKLKYSRHRAVCVVATRSVGWSQAASVDLSH